MYGIATSRLPTPSWFPQFYSHLNRFITIFVAHTVVLSLFAGKLMNVLKLILIFVFNVQIILLHYVLGAFTKLRKASVSFVTSVRLPARNNSTRIGWILIKFIFGHFSKNCLEH